MPCYFVFLDSFFFFFLRGDWSSSNRVYTSMNNRIRYRVHSLCLYERIQKKKKDLVDNNLLTLERWEGGKEKRQEKRFGK